MLEQFLSLLLADIRKMIQEQKISSSVAAARLTDELAVLWGNVVKPSHISSMPTPATGKQPVQGKGHSAQTSQHTPAQTQQTSKEPTTVAPDTQASPAQVEGGKKGYTVSVSCVGMQSTLNTTAHSVQVKSRPCSRYNLMKRMLQRIPVHSSVCPRNFGTP